MADDFGAWVRERREGEGWTQTELAQRASIDQTNVSAVETGRRPPTAAFCVAIARAFNYPASYVLEKAGIDANARDDDEATRDAVHEFRRRLARLAPEDREEAVDLVNGLLDTLAQRSATRTRAAAAESAAGRNKSAKARRATAD